jgi:hypothetical protein
MRHLKITTLAPAKEGWIDRDMIMLHACFQLLVDFIEKENGLEYCNYEHHKESIDEAKYLYDWWKANVNIVTIDDKVADEHLMRLIKIRGFLWT